MTITQIQPISVVFTLPQKDVPEVQAAMAKGALTTLAYGQDDHTKLDEGSLLLVNNTINQSSGTAQLKATFPNANRALWPGEFVNVRLIVTSPARWHHRATERAAAGPERSLVFIVQPDGTVQQRPVTVARHSTAAR